MEKRKQRGGGDVMGRVTRGEEVMRRVGYMLFPSFTAPTWHVGDPSIC
jgi:hypothetical protein